MAFVEQRMLDCVSYGFQGGPTYGTQEVGLRNGYTRRNGLRSRPLMRFVAPYQNIDADDHAIVIRAFNACQGMLHSFRFKDWADYTATAESLGTAPSGTTAVQLKKTYTFGALSTVRNIIKPVSGTVVVYQNGVPKAGTLDTATGLFTPTSAWTPGATLTWTGEFDVPVRFASDDLVFDFNNPGRLTTDISLVEDFSA